MLITLVHYSSLTKLSIKPEQTKNITGPQLPGVFLTDSTPRYQEHENDHTEAPQVAFVGVTLTSQTEGRDPGDAV